MADTTSIPIKVWKVLGAGDAQPMIKRFPEYLGLTIKSGTPVLLSSGYLIERTAIDDGTKQVAGICLEPGANLAASGVAKTLTYGSVENQASAVLIPGGAPLNLGTMGVALAVDSTWFVGKIVDGVTLAVTLVGATYGLTKATNGYWSVDTSITTLAAGACVEIMELVDKVGTLGSAPGRVAFRFIHARQQFGGYTAA